jgi:type I restriction-modification system DNA methylase subunit
MSRVTSFVSEQDFVSTWLLPRLREAANVVAGPGMIDFHVNRKVNGWADLTVEKGGKRVLVVEAKFKKKVGRVERDIEPRDPEAVRQAAGYALDGGFHYYATCNARRMVLFQFKPGLRPFEAEVMAVDYQRDENWAENTLKAILELVPVRLKQLDDTLVDTLHEAAADLMPEFVRALREKLRDHDYHRRFSDWLASQGLESSEQTFSIVAEQSTYLQINKLLFYQVIRAIYPDRLQPLRITEEEEVDEALGRFFADARKIDYRPIYESDIISEIPLTPRGAERIRTLLDTLNEFDFSGMGDFVGRMYEKLIPPDERKRLGQFYTPPNVIELIVRLTVTQPEAKVLDPGCGSGGFLVSAYQQLRKLNGIPPRVEGAIGEQFHQQLLDQVYGVDINQFPAHLSVINLAVQNPRARVRTVNVVPKDFFDLKPGQAVLAGFTGLDAEGGRTTVTLPPAFDVVVANPPYIRQEYVGDREKGKIKNLIESEFRDVSIGGPSGRRDRVTAISEHSDIYIYFYLHGLAFLKNGGRLGFISSTKWLEVKYGEAFQKFLVENCKILYVIEFDRAVFPDAEVNTEVTILERVSGEKNRGQRDGNRVKFVHINRALPMDRLLERIQKEERADDEELSIATVKQEDLKPGKWSVYLRAPPIYHELLMNPKLKPFGSFAKIVYGVKTGYDPYFILDREKLKEWRIERKYLKPCSPPPRALKGYVIEPEDIHQWFFMVHESKSQLRGTNALKYIQFGEKLEAEASKRRTQPLPLLKVETVRNRDPWYSLPRLPVPSIVYPLWFRHQFRPLLNNAGAHATNFFYYVIVGEDDRTAMAALLHSTLTQFLLEISGRQYSGMLHLMTYELQQLPMIDPAEINGPRKKKLEALFWKLNTATVKVSDARLKVKQFKGKSGEQPGLFEKDATKDLEAAKQKQAQALAELDAVVYEILGLTNEAGTEIRNGLIRLREIRRRATRGLQPEPEN